MPLNINIIKKPSVTGLTLIVSLFNSKTDSLRRSHAPRIHNAFNKSSQDLTYGVSLIAHYSCRHKEITAVHESK